MKRNRREITRKGYKLRFSGLTFKVGGDHRELYNSIEDHRKKILLFLQNANESGRFQIEYDKVFAQGELDPNDRRVMSISIRPIQYRGEIQFIHYQPNDSAFFRGKESLT